MKTTNETAISHARVAIAAALALVAAPGCDNETDVPRDGVDKQEPGDDHGGDDGADDDDDDHDGDRHDDDGGDDDGGDDEPCPGDDDDDELVLLDPSVCAPANGSFTVDIDNRFFPLPAGKTLVLEGMEDDTLVRVEIHVLEMLRTVAGVETLVVSEEESEDGVIVEISQNFYAQAEDGTVCYFGEEVANYENGEITSTEGSWLAGENNARPGIIMPGDPQPGTMFATEIAPGVAEDMSAIVELGAPVSTPAGDFTDTLHAIDWNPLEGETIDDGEDKYYAAGVGIVVDDTVELISCDGDGNHAE